MGVYMKRHDLANNHEEADRQIYKTIHFACDDTDVFVLLVHFYKILNITNELFMVPTGSKTRNVANIGITVRKHEEIVLHPYMH